MDAYELGMFSHLNLNEPNFLFDDESEVGIIEEIPENPKKSGYEKQLPTAYRCRMVTPIVEIFSVSIHSNQISEGGEKCEIHVHISVVDDESGDTFDIFARSKDDPECIVYGGTLLLSFPMLDSNEGVNVIRPSKHVSVKVLLFDKAHDDMLIAKGRFTLDRTLIDCKGQPFCEHVHGNGGFASVNYAIFPYAVVATVHVLFFSKDDDFDLLSGDVKVPNIFEDNDSDGGFQKEIFDEADYIQYGKQEFGSGVADIFGIVTARNDLVFDVSSDKKDYFNSSVLLRKSPEQSVKVRSGDFIQLSRSVVAVPAYSSLKVEVDFSDCDTQKPFGRSTVEFRTEDNGTYKDIVGGNGRIRVRVKWSDVYHKLNRATELKRSSVAAITPEIGNVEEVERQKLLLEQPSPSTLCTSGMPPATPNNYHEPIPLVEVFSVVVCGKDSEPLSFYGKILVNYPNFRIFSKDAKCPQHCPALGTHLELDCHVSFDAMDDFSMWISLKDVNRSVISKGHISLRAFTLDKWLDWRLCSLIRGDGGFAAVYYARFEDALSAKVDVKLYGKTPSSRVYGKLVARYGTHDYTSSYEEEYYQSVIFHKDAKEDITLEMGGSSMPLLKSVVAFPRNSSLILEADLTVSSVNAVDSNLPQETDSLQGNIEFQLSVNSESSGRITCEDVYIVVTVKCGYTFD